MDPLAEIENYHDILHLLARFEKIIDLIDKEHNIRQSADYKELRLTLWLIDHQKSIGCPF